MDLSGMTNNDILHVSFNQDNTCLAVGTETGFFVCDTNPLNLRFTRQFDEGIGIVEMLFRCNILALVGGGKRPRYPPNCVMIWDDHQERKIAELEFRSAVKAVKMRRDRIVVALDTKIYVYNFEDLRLIGQQDTCNASLGLIALSPTSNNIVLAFPAPTIGDVCVLSTDAQGNEQKQTMHTTTSALAQLALDPTGTRLAITSGKGTLIRVLNLQSNSKDNVTTYRRGTQQATIQSMAFSADSAFLACTSSRQTVHIFHMESSSSGSYFGSLMGAGEPRAVASYSIPEDHSICAFVPSNADEVGSNRKILVVLGSSGAYYNLEVSKDGDNWKVIDLNHGEKKSYLPS